MNIGYLIRSLRPVRSEHYIILSILIYILPAVLKDFLFLPLVNAISIFAATMFIWCLIKYWKGIPIKGWVGLFYILLIIWSVWLTIHMLFIALPGHTDSAANMSLTGKLLKYLTSPYFFPNLLPFMLFCMPKADKFDFNYLWRVMWLLCILYLCYAPFVLYNISTYNITADMLKMDFGEKGSYGDFISNSTMGIGNLSPLILMIYFKRYLPNSQWRSYLLTQVIALFITVYLARRGGTSIMLIYFVFAWGVYLLNDNKGEWMKKILLALVTVALIYAIFMGGKDTLFSLIIQRGDEDTRSVIEENFIADMNTNGGWILGRGWMGEYYAPIVDEYRRMIETGYFGMILKGGLLYLISYIFILGISVYRGCFKSNNLFCKSFAIIILVQILSMKPSGHPAFNFSHFAVWLGVWICNSNYFLRLKDNEIKCRIF